MAANENNIFSRVSVTCSLLRGISAIAKLCSNILKEPTELVLNLSPSIIYIFCKPTAQLSIIENNICCTPLSATSSTFGAQEIVIMNASFKGTTSGNNT